VIPWSFMYPNAWTLAPPLQPWLPYAPAQSTNCCSDRSTVFLLNKAHDSHEATAANAQHDPHDPWFFTLDTAPCVVQSISMLGMSPLIYSSIFVGEFVISPKNRALNSSSVKAENWLIPILYVWVESALCFAITSRFLLKINFR